jgi:ubiquinone biosynthesis protein
MPLSTVIHLPRNIHRLAEILHVLIRNGLGHFVRRMNLQEHLPMLERVLGRREGEPVAQDEETVARRVATALQELGPTFVKMGQMLSSRPDVLPESFIEEFRKLQDRVAPFSSEEAHQILHKELGSNADLFEHVEAEPFASGSIAQVHRARLLDGSEVVVKIRRPGIERTVLGDVAILSFLAQRARRHFPEFNPVAIVAEFEKSIRREMDLVTEASYTSKFHDALKDEPGLRCPKVYWDLTTSQVLTLEWLEGINVSQQEELVRRGTDLKKVTAVLANAFMKQFFRMGMFHADPHPGNLLVMPDGTLALVDFGLVGHLTGELRSQLVTILIALARRDVDLAIEAYAEIGEFAEGADPHRLKPDLMELLDKYYGMPLKRIETQKVFADVTRIARSNGVILPRDLILLARAFVTVTSVARQLDPDFDLAAMAQPHTQALLKDKFSPTRIAKGLGINAWHLARLFARLPSDIRQILRKLQTGSLQFVFRHEGLEPFTAGLDRVSNRLSVSVILGSVVIGSSVIIHRGGGPMLFGVSAFGLLGYVLAGVLGMWLVWDILRSGRY